MKLIRLSKRPKNHSQSFSPSKVRLRFHRYDQMDTVGWKVRLSWNRGDWRKTGAVRAKYATQNAPKNRMCICCWWQDRWCDVTHQRRDVLFWNRKLRVNTTKYACKRQSSLWTVFYLNTRIKYLSIWPWELSFCLLFLCFINSRLRPRRRCDKWTRFRH